MLPLRLVCTISICLFLSIHRVVSGVPRQRGVYRDVLDEWMDDVDETEDRVVGGTSTFPRVSRIPIDFSFNSDLALLRRMISENRPQGHKLLAFGK